MITCCGRSRQSGCRPLPAGLVEAKLAAVVQQVGPCGHYHLPAWLRLPGGRHVIDPGSVGLPAYRDDRPFPHAMEAGSPHARYSVVNPRAGPGPGGPANVAVAYDWSAAARAAEGNGRPDWAACLHSGRAS